MVPTEVKRQGTGQGGFSLTECAVATAVVAVLACVALPSFVQQELRAGRLDAVDALTRLQVAQEQHRAAHGAYAHNMQALVGAAPHSRQGLYTLKLATGPGQEGYDTYAAVATAQGRQTRDTACAELTLNVRSGFPQEGPNQQCWNR
jgi:type IV pilus assembly protein PilE